MTGFDSKRKMAQDKVDPKAWAMALREKERAGHNLKPAIKEMWRRALNLPENHQLVVKEQRKNKFLD
jgi:hypothetical protein